MPNDAVAIGLKFLTGRRLTVEELRQRMKRRGVESVECEEALNRLIDLGLLDDRAYAHDMVADALERGKHGPLGVRARLLRRGFAPDLVSEMLKEGEDAWQVIALRVAQEYDREDERDRVRLMRRLHREGFASPIIQRTLNSADQHDSA